MKLTDILGLIGGGAQILTTASTAAVIVGAIYLVDCRVAAKTSEAIDRCYFTALPMMGVGIAGRGGFSLGYNTFNPSLKREEERRGPLGGRRG
jgi:hypothetical protein